MGGNKQGKKIYRVLETALKIVIKKEPNNIEPWNHLGWKNLC